MARFILINRYFHPDESATSQFLTDLARHLAKRHEVVVLASRQRLEDARAGLPPHGVLGGARIRRLWGTSLGRNRLSGRVLDYLSFLAAVGAWLLVHARRGDIVLAKTDPPLLGVLTALATPSRGVRRAQWLQDLYPETAERLGVLTPGGMAARVMRSLRNWSLRRSHLVVTVNQTMLEELRPGAGAAVLRHIPNWADDFPPEPAKEPGRGPLVIGYSGNLGRAHPIEGLLGLAAQPTEGTLELVISGGGAHHDRLRAQVRQLGRRNWTFLPYQPREQLAELLRRADVHLVILDPRLEGCVFPSKLYGILAAGRPVVLLGDPAGEVGRILEGHSCGWSVPPDSGAGLLALLERLGTDRAALAQAGRNARAAYECQFSRSDALNRWEEALHAVQRQTV